VAETDKAPMGTDLLQYESAELEWTLVYELLADSLIVKQSRVGDRGRERGRYLYELKDCHAHPDRALRINVHRYPPRFWLVTALILVLTALSCAGVGAAGIPLPLPHAAEAKDYVGIAAVVMVVELVVLAVALPPLLHKRLCQYYVTFNRVSDGAPLFTLVSAPERPTDAFENFVAQVLAAIHRQRGEEPPPDERITRGA
jgi:hypothetical protein